MVVCMTDTTLRAIFILHFVAVISHVFVFSTLKASCRRMEKNDGGNFEESHED